MKRLLWLPLLLAALALSASAMAGNGRETHFGPYASTSPDNGTCGVKSSEVV